MTENEIRSATVAEIVVTYEKKVKENGLEIMNGNADAANAAYDVVWLCSKELKRRGVDSQEALLPLLGSDDPQVRLCAAKDALDFAPALGVVELENLARSNVIWRLDAQMIFREWQREKLKFSGGK